MDCKLCLKLVDDDDYVTLGEKGATGINAASVLRKVDITVACGDIVHKVCRKKFIDKNYIYTSEVCGELKTQKHVLRKELTFNHRTDCFYVVQR